MRIAYLVLAHNNPQLLKRKIQILSCQNCRFFIHIDGKSDMGEFSQISGDNVEFSDRRFAVHWGGFALVDATLTLLRQALEDSDVFDYFVLQSGSDYPLRSGGYIHSFLEESRDQEFINIAKIPTPEAGIPLSKINRVWFDDSRPLRQITSRGLAKVGLATRDYREFLGELEPFSGDTWWALTRDACQYVLKFADSNPHLAEFFRRTISSDEMFFHTILGNSGFASRIQRDLFYVDWSSGGPHPAMIGEEHLDFFEKQDRIVLSDRWGTGEVLFTRKCSDKRLDLVDRIDEMIRRKDGGQKGP